MPHTGDVLGEVFNLSTWVERSKDSWWLLQYGFLIIPHNSAWFLLLTSVHHYLILPGNQKVVSKCFQYTSYMMLHCAGRGWSTKQFQHMVKFDIEDICGRLNKGKPHRAIKTWRYRCFSREIHEHFRWLCLLREWPQPERLCKTGDGVRMRFGDGVRILSLGRKLVGTGFRGNANMYVYKYSDYYECYFIS